MTFANLEYSPKSCTAVQPLKPLLTVPVAWWGIERWLGGFAYRIPINLWVFAVAAGVVVVLTGSAVTVVVLRAVGGVPARVLSRND